MNKYELVAHAADKTVSAYTPVKNIGILVLFSGLLLLTMLGLYFLNTIYILHPLLQIVLVLTALVVDLALTSAYAEHSANYDSSSKS